jgi:hypothetical protein
MANAIAILTGQVDFNVRRDVDDQIIAAISQLVEGQATIMATLDDVNAKLGELKTKLDAVGPAIDALQQKITDALAAENISPATQAKIDAAFQAASDMLGEAQTALDDAASTP